MRSPCLSRPLLPALFAVAICMAARASGQQIIPPEHHPWGSFQVGSWKLVRTTSESLDSKGQVASVTITDTKTSLVATDDSSYTLRSEVTVDVAGRRIASTPHVVKHGFFGETPGQAYSVQRLGEASLTIDRRVIPCELQQIVVEDQAGKLTSLVHYAPEVAPFVLRRETSLEVNGDGKKNTSLVEVIALDLPHRLRGDLKEASYIKTTQKLPAGTKVTLEVHCEDLPGSVAAHWATETDAAGRVVRRSTLELLGYGVPIVTTEAAGVMPQRYYRTRKAARRMESR
jgi:hypothetical protein